MRRPGFPVGALIGALATAPLMGLLFLAQRLTGAPFLPFDLFDWLARVLPGPIVTFGIDAMVDTIRALNLGAVADVAKTAEKGLALVIFFLGGAFVAGGTYLMLRRGASRRAVRASLVVGAVLAVATFLVSLSVNDVTAANPAATGAWILAVFLAWGAAIGRSYDRLQPAGARHGAAEPPEPSLTPDHSADGVERLGRRRFLLKLGGASALITVAGTALGTVLREQEPPEVRTEVATSQEPRRWSDANRMPNAGAEVQPAPGTRPEFTPLEEHYRIDINIRPPSVDGSTWRLRVDGLVAEPLALTLDDLRAYPAIHQIVTLSCISNRLGGDLIGTTRWSGVSLQDLLPDLGLRGEATHLRISSVDGFFEIVPIETILADERVMLAYAWDGVPLPQRNGYPLRVYVPDLYGMKQPKWIDRIEAIGQWEEGYWVRRGWDAEARMHATSVLDTVATENTIDDGEDPPLVPVGGIAHAGARGISRVEVRVDEGPWQEARLRRPLSETTWVVWRFDWPFAEGEHTFTVRCVDGEGEPQIEERSGVRPDGATGLISEDVTL